MPRSSQASRQNCAGCATVHACNSGKPAAPCRAIRSAIAEPVPVSVTSRANHARTRFSRIREKRVVSQRAVIGA